MKQILIALLLAFTTSTVINAQKQSSIEKDSRRMNPTQQ